MRERFAAGEHGYATDMSRLAEYRANRDLEASGEPAGGEPGDHPRFVVQRHDASQLHFDFRIEVEGVLASWAVPKGPSTDPQDKRLATRTEDHPLDYAEFEGRIPPEQYGAGTVIVWDTGIYRNLTAHRGNEVPVAEALENGHVKVWLEGSKLRGGYALTDTKLRGDERNWLLVKVDDEVADPTVDPVRSQQESVLTGRTNDEVADE